MGPPRSLMAGMKSKEELLAITRTPAYTQFIAQQEREPVSNYLNHLEAISQDFANAALLDAYHGLELMFREYPRLVSIRPRWKPAIDNNEFHVRFALEIESLNEGGEVESGMYGFEQYPDCVRENAAGTYDLMMELGECIYPEIWAMCKDTNLCRLSEPYTSLEEVQAAKKEDLGEFLTRFEQYALAATTLPAPAKKSRHSL